MARPTFSGVCSTDILPLLPGPRLDRSYLAHFLLLPASVAWAASNATGANLPRLSPDKLKNLKVPLPPLSEQRRVAAILDGILQLRAQRLASLGELEHIVASTFRRMFEGRRWPIRLVSDYVARFEGGTSIAADTNDESLSSGNRILKVSAVTWMTFHSQESKPLPGSYAPPVEHFVRPGDLLFSRANTSRLVGAVAYVHETPPNLVLPDKLWRFVWRDSDAVDPLFVWALFQTRGVREQIEARATGTSGSMKNISQTKTLGIRTIFPPVQAQRAFSRVLNAIEKLKAAHHASLAEMDALFASLQHRAFSGQL